MAAHLAALPPEPLLRTGAVIFHRHALTRITQHA
jgi:hypothetical protein